MSMNLPALASAALRGWLLLTLSIAAIPPARAADEAQPDANAILMESARFLAATDRFSVSLRSGYDVLQASGQKIEFNERRKLVVDRPERLRVEVEQSDGNHQLVLFDGKAIAVVSTPQNVYAQEAKPGTIDDAVAYFLRDLRMRLPLAMLLVNRLPDELDRRVQAVDYVEETGVLGAPAHHLAARTDTVDFQIWVAAGKQPLPLRVVLTYKTAEGTPQFWAEFADWNLAPQVSDATFAFTAPQGARKIAFLTQVPKIAVQGTAIPAQPDVATSPQAGEQK